jgi:hypothetical protein
MEEYLIRLLASIFITYFGIIAASAIDKNFRPDKPSTHPTFWRLWLLMSFLGGLFGGFYSDYLVDGNWVWAMLGATLGLAQWFALRHKLPVRLWWVIATAIGWGLVPIIGQVPYGGGITGLIVGLLQMVGVKVENKTWWILGSGVTILFTGLLGHIIIDKFLYNLMGPHISWALGWGILSLIAAACQLPLLARLIPKEEKINGKI